MTFDGVEVVNFERLQTYVDSAGLVPPGVTLEACAGFCEGIGDALGQTYTAPQTDKPPTIPDPSLDPGCPWYDADDPDSLDFAGVVPLGFTGLSGSTRTVTMVETMRDGG